MDIEKLLALFPQANLGEKQAGAISFRQGDAFLNIPAAELVQGTASRCTVSAVSRQRTNGPFFMKKEQRKSIRYSFVTVPATKQCGHD